MNIYMEGVKAGDVLRHCGSCLLGHFYSPAVVTTTVRRVIFYLSIHYSVP